MLEDSNSEQESVSGNETTGGPANKPTRIPKLLGGGIGLAAGLLMAWFLYGWESPAGIVILLCFAFGFFIGSYISGDFAEDTIPRILKMKTEPPWPTVRKWSGLLFVAFLILGVLVNNERFLAYANLRDSLFIIFGGLALLVGSPLLAAIVSKLQKLWILSFFIGLTTVTVGAIVLLDIETSPLFRFSILSAGVVVPLVIILWRLRNKPSANKETAGGEGDISK